MHSDQGLFFIVDPALVDLMQYELPILADTLRGYLQDLPSPVVPAAIYSELVYTAQGETSRKAKGNIEELKQRGHEHRCCGPANLSLIAILT